MKKTYREKDEVSSSILGNCYLKKIPKGKKSLQHSFNADEGPKKCVFCGINFCGLTNYVKVCGI